MNKIFSGVIVVAILAATVLFYLKPENHSVDQSKTTAYLNDHNQITHDRIYAESSGEHKQNHSSLSNQHFQNNQIDRNLMSVLEPNAVRSRIIPAYFKDPEHGFLFSFDMNNMATKQVGDRFELKMLKFDLHRHAVIQSVDQLDQDIVKWRGSFEGYPEDLNYFTITQSQNDQYAILKVFTDKGSYIAEIKAGIGLAKPETVLADDALYTH